MAQVVSNQRTPGRPRGSSPHGLPPGSNGGPEVRFRTSPLVAARIKRAGGSEWLKALAVEALGPLKVDLYTCSACKHESLTSGPCENCGKSCPDWERIDAEALSPNLQEQYIAANLR